MGLHSFKKCVVCKETKSTYFFYHGRNTCIPCCKGKVQTYQKAKKEMKLTPQAKLIHENRNCTSYFTREE